MVIQKKQNRKKKKIVVEPGKIVLVPNLPPSSKALFLFTNNIANKGIQRNKLFKKKMYEPRKEMLFQQAVQFKL